MTDITLCQNIARAFWKVGKECNDTSRDAQYQTETFPEPYSSDDGNFDYTFYNIPAIVNLALSCELYLKGLLLRELSEEQLAKTHDLKILYDKLSDEQRETASTWFSEHIKYDVLLEDTMKTHAKSFQSWRYVYERRNISSKAYTDNLQLAAEAIRYLYFRKGEKHA